MKNNIKTAVIGIDVEDWYHLDYLRNLDIDKNYSIIDDYELGIHYEKHDHTSTVITPNINYQFELTKKINDTFLHQNIEEKINKFYRYLQN